MAKRKKGRAISGWLAIDKPQGMGSTSVVNRVKRLFDANKVGHGGTLDPMATGVLPIALGEATKTMPYALDANKAYEFEVHWGVETDSLDADGVATRTVDYQPSEAEILAIIPSFIGPIEQVPPKVSALKVDGQRAYDLAREGEDFELAPRATEVIDLTLLNHGNGRSQFAVSAIKGFYVRALARDLAYALGTVGHLTALRRVRSGPFVAEDCVPLEFLEDLAHMSSRDAVLMPLDRVLVDIPALDLGIEAAQQLRNGQSVAVFRKSLLDKILSVTGDKLGEQPVVLVKAGEQPVGIGQFEQGRIKPVRLFNL